MPVLSLPSAVRKSPLLQPGKPGRTALMGAGAGVLVFALTELFHRLLTANYRVFSHHDLADLLAAVVVGYLAHLVLRAEQQRRAQAIAELKMIADMNHHIRNALHLLALSAASTHDKAAVAVIEKASERIMWTLREVLPGRDKGLQD